MEASDSHFDLPLSDARRRWRTSDLLACLCAVAAVLFAVVIAGILFVLLLFARSHGDPLIGSFGGWQVDLTEAAIAVLLVAAAVVSAVVLVRLYRNLQRRTPHRRLAILLAILPGFLLGGLFAAPIRPALSWASDRTEAAVAARTVAPKSLLLHRNAPAPPVPALNTAPAPGALAARLLHASDLGSGWYDTERPSATADRLPPVAARAGETAAASVSLSQQHWDGLGWAMDCLLSEDMHTFGDSSEARRYVVTTWASLTPLTTRRIAGVTVWQQSKPVAGVDPHFLFVVRNTAFTVVLSGTETGLPQNLNTEVIVAAAINRAVSAR